jgi:hypothetical protein
MQEPSHTSSGSIYGWGRNVDGEIGLGFTCHNTNTLRQTLDLGSYPNLRDFSFHGTHTWWFPLCLGMELRLLWSSRKSSFPLPSYARELSGWQLGEDTPWPSLRTGNSLGGDMTHAASWVSAPQPLPACPPSSPSHLHSNLRASVLPPFPLWPLLLGYWPGGPLHLGPG